MNTDDLNFSKKDLSNSKRNSQFGRGKEPNSKGTVKVNKGKCLWQM